MNTEFTNFSFRVLTFLKIATSIPAKTGKPQKASSLNETLCVFYGTMQGDVVPSPKSAMFDSSKGPQNGCPLSKISMSHPISGISHGASRWLLPSGSLRWHNRGHQKPRCAIVCWRGKRLRTVGKAKGAGAKSRYNMSVSQGEPPQRGSSFPLAFAPNNTTNCTIKTKHTSYHTIQSNKCPPLLKTTRVQLGSACCSPCFQAPNGLA